MLGLVADLRQGRGQIVSLVGEAGLGKSRIIAELHQALTNLGLLEGDAPGNPVAAGSQGLGWHEGRSRSYESSTPYAPFVGLLNSFFRFDVADSDAEKYGKITQALTGTQPEGALNAAPLIATILGVPVPEEDKHLLQYLQPPQVKEKTFQAVTRILERTAASRPTVLVFEDLHWSDPASLELLENLMALTGRVPLMVMVVLRPVRQEPAWRIHESA